MTEQQQAIETFSCSFYTPDGTKMYFTIPVRENIWVESIFFASAALANGLTHEPPGIDDGNSITIVKVMRRAKSDGTPIIDFYPEWGFPVSGKETFGTFRNLGIYMNESEPKLLADFLTISGFTSLDQIPLYDGQAPLKRTQERPHPKETNVPTPFKIIREQGEEKIGSDGKPFRSWKLVRYEAINGNSPAIAPEGAKEPPMTTSSIDDKDTTWNTSQTKVKEFCSAVVTYLEPHQIAVSASGILDAINTITQQKASKFSELVNITRADAWASVLLQMDNGNKANALAQTKGDETLIKAINFWAKPLANVEF